MNRTGGTQATAAATAPEAALRRSQAYVRILAEAAALTLKGTEDPHALLAPLLDPGAGDLGFDQVYSYDVVSEQRELHLVFAFGIDEARRDVLRHLSFDDALSGKVAECAERIIATDVQRSPDPRLAHARTGAVRAFACFPIKVAGAVVNVMSFTSLTQAAFDDETIAFFETIARYVEVARERRAGQQALREGEERYRALFEAIDEGFCVIEFFDGPHGPLSDYVHIEANPAYTQNAGIPDVVGQKLREMVPDEADAWVARYGEVLRTGKPIRFEQELVATGRHLELAAFRVGPASQRQVAVLFKDVTARKIAETRLKELNENLEARVAQAIEEQRQTEEALRQAQKMEAVGQLTGGLAHDFNNLLAGISGSFEMIGVRMAQGRSADVERYLSAGQGATRRAAALTHRLLAFSRRQTLSPKPMNINKLMTDFVELVQRTVGPSIDVETVSASSLWQTMVDPNQLENALLNLCINARDAMPHGGKITLETGNRWLDHRAATEHGLEPGQYVTVCVSDTGTGIDKEILPRVFDPFFTTKPIGQGTGLGLSMVYGFARQSHGHVRIYSEIGEGTMVCIYLPRHLGTDEADDGARPTHAATSTDAGETVLVIDDEPTVRMLICDSLKDLGYVCKEAADGAEGLKRIEEGGRLDLLITDVGLPGLNGRQVADAARARLPDLKVLFITGYAENAALNHGHVGPGMEVMTKPFSVDDLAARVERMLKNEASR